MSVTVSDDVRRRLHAGEALNSRQVADEYGVNVSVLRNIIAGMLRDGAEFERTPAPTAGKRGTPPLVWTLKAVEVDPAAWGKGRGVKRTNPGQPKRKVVADAAVPAVVEAKVPAPAKVNGNGKVPAVPPLTIGAHVEVCLVALDRDGTVRVGLRNDDSTWLATVDGFTAS